MLNSVLHKHLETNLDTSKWP